MPPQILFEMGLIFVSLKEAINFSGCLLSYMGKVTLTLERKRKKYLISVSPVYFLGIRAHAVSLWLLIM